MTAVHRKTKCRRAAFVSAALSILCFATSGWAEEVATIGLDGRWKLERTENFEEYLKASGTSWWKRKLANLASSRLRTTIRQKGAEFEVESDSPVETRTEIVIADGVTARSAETAAGDMMTWTAHIDGEALVVDGHGELGHRIVRREIVDGAMLMTIVNPDVDASCKLYFVRESDDETSE